MNMISTLRRNEHAEGADGEEDGRQAEVPVRADAHASTSSSASVAASDPATGVGGPARRRGDGRGRRPGGTVHDGPVDGK